MNKLEYLQAKLKLIDAFYKLEIGWTSSQITKEKQRSQIKEMAATQKYTREREDKEMIFEILQDSEIGKKMCECDWKKLIDDLFEPDSVFWTGERKLCFSSKFIKGGERASQGLTGSAKKDNYCLSPKK